jgi:hypothetical protein
MAGDQTTIEKMAREIEELKAWISTNEEKEYRHTVARVIRRTLGNSYTVTSISGPMVLTREIVKRRRAN